MDTALIITLVFSIISSILVGIELIITVRNHNKERTVKVVTEQRSNWIQRLREIFVEIVDLLDNSIDSLIKLERQMNNGRSVGGKNFYINELRTKYVKLRLMLNFENAVDLRLLNTLEDLICRIDLEVTYSYVVGFSDYNVKDFVAEKELVVLYMSMYLKAEWERLKQEGKYGKANPQYFEHQYNELLAKNKETIEKLSNKAFRVSLNKIIKYLESDPQFRYENIATYNCLNILDKV